MPMEHPVSVLAENGEALDADGNASPGAPGEATPVDRGMSEGQRQLQAFRQRPGESFETLAAALSTNKGTVHGWATGKKTPGVEWRARIESALGIPAAAWDQVRADARRERSPLESADLAARDAQRQAGSSSTLEELRRLHRRVRSIDLDGLTPEVQARVCDSEARILALIHKAEEDIRKAAAIAEHHAAAHPGYHRVVKRVLEALRPYGPDAARAVVEAFDPEAAS
jgi:transcriptional regulator with XRE-family HTH domain